MVGQQPTTSPSPQPLPSPISAPPSKTSSFQPHHPRSSIPAPPSLSDDCMTLPPKSDHVFSILALLCLDSVGAIAWTRQEEYISCKATLISPPHWLRTYVFYVNGSRIFCSTRGLKQIHESTISAPSKVVIYHPFPR